MAYSSLPQRKIYRNRNRNRNRSQPFLAFSFGDHSLPTLSNRSTRSVMEVGNLPNTDMEILGLDDLTSPNSHKLFTLGKDWIVEFWAAAERKIARIEILPKLIGRNKGFILDVHVCDPCETVRYFAKIQSPHIDTVITHYLLKYTNSGPDEFFIALLDPVLRYGCFCEEHGVITRNISGWRMASSWTTEGEKKKVTSEAGVLQGFMLTLLIHLGRFGNIPRNRDNWGFVNNEEAALDSISLKLVDFSAGGFSYALLNRNNFQRAWADTLLLCTYPDSAPYLPANLRNEWMRSFLKRSILEHARQFPWLHSQEAFVTLLQQVCVDTENWLLGTIRAPVEEPVEVGMAESAGGTKCAASLADGAMNAQTDTLLDTAKFPIPTATPAPTPASAPAPAVAVVSKDGVDAEKSNLSGDKSNNTNITPPLPPPPLRLVAFRDRPMPNVKRCSGTQVTLIGEYILWVGQWNDEVTEFCKWFPFPAAATMDTQNIVNKVNGEAVVEESGEERKRGVSDLLHTEDAPIQDSHEGGDQKGGLEESERAEDAVV